MRIPAGLLVAASALALGSSPAGAEAAWSLQQALGSPEGLTISGTARIRYEALEGQFRPGLDPKDDLVSLRASLFAEYDTGPVRVGGELIDARAYDADAGGAVGTGEVNAAELVQAYVAADLGDALGGGSESKLQLGRFTMDLGSRRLVGRNNFRNTTNAFTGARFDWRGKGKERLTLFYTLPHLRLPRDKAEILDNEVKWDRESFDLTFSGMFVALPEAIGTANLELYAFALDEDDSPRFPTRNRSLVTPGLRLTQEPRAGRIDYEFEAAYQFGEIRSSNAPNAAEQDVSAYSVHAEIGRQFTGPWSPRLSLEFDLATGDGRGGGHSRFDSLYGPRRPDWGPTGIYGPLGRSNIVSPGARLEVKPSDRWNGFVAYRAAWLEADTDAFAFTGVRDASGRSGDFAGHQIEYRARYWIIPKLLKAETGGALLPKGRFLQAAPNANRSGDTLYGYADLAFTF